MRSVPLPFDAKAVVNDDNSFNVPATLASIEARLNQENAARLTDSETVGNACREFFATINANGKTYAKKPLVKAQVIHKMLGGADLASVESDVYDRLTERVDAQIDRILWWKRGQGAGVRMATPEELAFYDANIDENGKHFHSADPLPPPAEPVKGEVSTAARDEVGL